MFVNSMSDLFHPDVPESFVAQVWETMARASWHTFQVLTKRPERMPGLLRRLGLQDPPLQNVWVGTSIENRRFVDRAEHLRRTPAAVRFISAEPLLGPLRCSRRTWPDGYSGASLCLVGIDWLIAGGESGPKHRPIKPEWVRDLRDGCERAGTAFFFKQWGGRTPKAGGRQLDGRTHDAMPPGAERGERPSADAEPDGRRPAQTPRRPSATRRPAAASASASREALGSDRRRPKRRVGLGSQLRHELDRAGSRLRERFARRVVRRGGGEGKWRWSDERAQACERAIRELIADATRPDATRLQRRAQNLLAAAHEILDEQPTRAASRAEPESPAAGGNGGSGGEDREAARGEASSDTSRRSLVDVGQASGAVTEQCADCFGDREPCPVCVAAAGDPSPGEYVLGWGVEQVRRCGCGRVYGAYHAGRKLCFLIQAPGCRQVERCVRCGQRLTARSTSDCTAELNLAAGADGGGGGGDRRSSAGRETSGDTPRAPRERVCQRPGCERPIPQGSRPEARYCSKGCRQALSRARVRDRGPVGRSEPRELCAWCEGPMPGGRRGEAVFCSKRCRQASSRFGLAVTRGGCPPPASAATTSTSDTSPAAATRAEDHRTLPAGATRRCSIEASGEVSPIATATEARPVEVRALTVELVDGLIACEEECFGAWCELLDGRGRVDPAAVIASQRPVREAAGQLRSWCANPHLRTLAELERLELLRAQALEEQAAAGAVKAQRAKRERDRIREAWSERRAWLYRARDALSIALGWPHAASR